MNEEKIAKLLEALTEDVGEKAAMVNLETDGNGFWAVGTDDWGNIVSYDHCESREEVEEFIRDELPGRGIMMTDNELYNALNMGEEAYA